MHFRGILIYPVSAKIGKKSSKITLNTKLPISWLIYGVKVILIGTCIPAEILPDGTYMMSKKSLIFSFKGSNLNELKEKDTLVR